MDRMRTLGISIALIVALAPLSAHAQLTGEFADALEVNVDFVTGVNGATDIAFAPDGRAVVTRKNGQITIRNTDDRYSFTQAQTTRSISSMCTQRMPSGPVSPSSQVRKQKA